MSTLILVVIFGLGFAYLTTQNTIGTTIRVGVYEWTNMPLYFIALGSLLSGLLISWIINTIDWISSAFTIKSKENQLRQTQQNIDELQQRITQLKLENSRLMAEKEEPKVEIKYAEKQHKPTVIERIRQNFLT